LESTVCTRTHACIYLYCTWNIQYVCTVYTCITLIDPCQTYCIISINTNAYKRQLFMAYTRAHMHTRTHTLTHMILVKPTHKTNKRAHTVDRTHSFKSTYLGTTLQLRAGQGTAGMHVVCQHALPHIISTIISLLVDRRDGSASSRRNYKTLLVEVGGVLEGLQQQLGLCVIKEHA